MVGGNTNDHADIEEDGEEGVAHGEAQLLIYVFKLSEVRIEAIVTWYALQCSGSCDINAALNTGTTSRRNGRR